MKSEALGNPARREFLAAGGALVVAFACRPAGASESAAPAPAEGVRLSGSLRREPWLDGWIRIDAEGRITVYTGKAELGQGIRTALIQLAAEELVVAPERIDLITADTARTPNEGYTAGSHSMQDSGTAIRDAAAQVRAILVGVAASRLDVAPERLSVADGVVSAGDRRFTYGELVSERLLHVEARPQSPLRAPAEHKVVGKSLPRVDIPAKVSGGPAYVQDLRLPDMVHARIVRPPSPGASLRQIDAAAAEKLPGVLQVVRNGRFIGVIARREYQAVLAQRTLAASARWDESATLPAPGQLYTSLLTAPSRDVVVLERVAPAVAAASAPTSAVASASVASASVAVGARTAGAGAARTLTASYSRPYQMHASIGPSCAVAQLVDGRYTVWTHSQGVFPLRGALAEMLGVATSRVHCIHVEGSGCYGHNGADDAAADAALLARALPGRPVRVQWMREDENAWEPYGPPMVSRVRAQLGAGGTIEHWHYEVWSNTHSTRPGAAGNLLAASHLAVPFKPPAPRPIPLPDGGGDRNAIPLYRLPNARIVYHFLPQMPLRVSALRSLGAYLNVFSIECFIDEIAAAARLDPVAFRLQRLDDARAREVVARAAERFGWDAWRSAPGRGRGFGFARYKNSGAYAAMAFEVEVLRDTGEIRVRRVVAAVESGETVNPDGLRNQIEGGIVQSASWTLAEEVFFDRVRVTSRDWGGYPILRFPQVPDQIEVTIVDRPGMPFLGSGEAAQGPAAAALANAVADATGVRLRDLPLTRERVRSALGP
jgi:CO/xanthine dehydrogenase Mo-binding subunit